MLLELTKPFESDGPVCAELRGVVDGEILRRALLDVATSCTRTGDEAIVLDLSKMESRCSQVEIQSVGIGLDSAGFRPSWRMAVVGTHLSSNIAVFEENCQTCGPQVRFFETVEEASAWLGNSN